LDDYAGSVIDIEAAGKVPRDKPFISRSDARAEIFSICKATLSNGWIKEERPLRGRVASGTFPRILRARTLPAYGDPFGNGLG
jgi:hypothetical protein